MVDKQLQVWVAICVLDAVCRALINNLHPNVPSGLTASIHTEKWGRATTPCREVSTPIQLKLVFKYYVRMSLFRVFVMNYITNQSIYDALEVQGLGTFVLYWVLVHSIPWYNCSLLSYHDVGGVHATATLIGISQTHSECISTTERPRNRRLQDN